jgi:hypothetical protein
VTTTVLTVLLSNVILASWLKPDWLHRLASVRAKPKGVGARLPENTEAFINSYAPPIWHGETTREFHALTKPLVRHLTFDEDGVT